MKKLFKILGVIVLSIILLLVALPFVFKGKIKTLLQEQINENVNAKVSFSDIDLSLIKSFPDFSLGINNLMVIGVDSFKNDTLISLEKLSLNLDLMSVIKGDQYKINQISLKKPNINVHVLESGKANYDISKPSSDTATEVNTDTSTTAFKLSLKELIIEEANIIYNDESLNTRVDILGLNHNLKGDFTQDIFDLFTSTKINQLSLDYDGVKYLNKVNTNLEVNLNMDLPNSKYTFKENSFKLNELDLKLDGFIAMPSEPIEMDLKFESVKTDFKNILSLVPAIYLNDFNSINTGGKLALNGFAKGTYSENSLPAFMLNLLIENAFFKYPDLAQKMSDINVNLIVSNPDGIEDNTVVDLKQFDFNIGSDPFKSKLLIKTPISDPYIDLHAHGIINLDNWKSMIPLDKETALTGIINADIDANGNYSQIEKEQYNNFNANGNLKITNLLYKPKDLPQDLTIKQGEFQFNPKKVDMPILDLKLGHSDLLLAGSITNFYEYLFSNGTISGNLDLKSNLLDLNPFMTETGQESKSTEPLASDTMPLKAIPIPQNIDFTLNTKIDKLIYDNLTLKNVSGSTQIKNGVVDLNNINAGIFNGNIGIGGSYDSRNINNPFVNFDLKLKNISANQLFEYFNSIKILAPIAQFIKGNISTEFNFKSSLTESLIPVFTSILSSGFVDVPDAKISGFAPLQSLSNSLKIPSFNGLDLKKVLLSFQIIDGKIMVKPFNFAVGQTKFKVEGFNRLDQSINYTVDMEIPRSMFGEANSVLNQWSADAQKIIPGYKLPEIINVAGLIGGTINAPSVSTNLKQTGKNLANDLKNQVLDEAEKKKAELEQKARQEIEKQKADAEARLKAEEQRLKNEIEAKKKAEEERLKKEADDKLKQELERQKQKAKDLFKR